MATIKAAAYSPTFDPFDVSFVMNYMNLNDRAILVPLVDVSGKVIGYTDKITAHLRGDLHLAFSLMIMRRRAGEREYLLQRRAMGKYHSGGLWANTCCSHPLPNENIKTSAKRRVAEELGIHSTLHLTRMGQIRYKHHLDNNMIEHELDQILTCEVDDIQWHGNPHEVMDVRWWHEHEILSKLNDTPNIFAAWFAEVFGFVQNANIASKAPV